MITALLLIASFVCLFFSHGCAMNSAKGKDRIHTVLIFILWPLGMLMAYAAGIVL